MSAVDTELASLFGKRTSRSSTLSAPFSVQVEMVAFHGVCPENAAGYCLFLAGNSGCHTEVILQEWKKQSDSSSVNDNKQQEH